MNDPIEQHPTLCPQDQRLLDALVASGFDRRALEPLSTTDRQRVDALFTTFGLLHDYPVEDADDALLDATLARIERADAEQRERMALDAERARAFSGRRRIRIPDFITVAAVLLIGVSVVWPVLSYVRNRSIDIACGDNMRQISSAFAQYAADFNGRMPVAVAGFSGPTTWQSVPTIANLDLLRRYGYCDQNHMNCPGHDHPGPSYSYQAQDPRSPAQWDRNPRMVLLGDRNPLIDAFYGGQFLPPLVASLNHGERGQNVLYGDGSNTWLGLPVVGHQDNIWLPAGVDRLHGDEPVPTDTFLVH